MVCTFNRTIEIEARPLCVNARSKVADNYPRRPNPGARRFVTRECKATPVRNPIIGAELPAEAAESDVAIKVIADGLTLARFARTLSTDEVHFALRADLVLAPRSREDYSFRLNSR
jgi:hypothetical protein